MQAQNIEAMILGKAKADSERQIYLLLFPPLNNSATVRFHVSDFIIGMKLFHKPLSFHIWHGFSSSESLLNS